MKTYNIVLHNIQFTFYIYESASYENLEYSEPHIHALPELFIVLDGDATISGDFGSKKITNGEICLIPPRVYHDVVNNASYRRLAIKFSIKKIKGNSKVDLFSLFSYVITNNTPIKASFNTIFTEEIYNCLKKETPLYDEKLKGLLLLAFIEFSESLYKSSENFPTEEFPNLKESKAFWLAQNDIILHQYACGNCSTKELEETLFLTCRQISRILLAEYGMNLNEFRIETRMRRALFYLQKTNKSLSQISEKLNFSSKESFSVCFKKYFGYPPFSVRKK